MIDKINALFLESKYDKEIIIYGLKLIFFNILSIGLLIILSICLNDFLFGVYFILTFGFVRLTIGGYHCRSIYMCLFVLGLLFVANYYLYLFEWYNFVMKICFIPSCLWLLYFLYRRNLKKLCCFVLVILFFGITNKLNDPIISGICIAELLYFIKQVK